MDRLFALQDDSTMHSNCSLWLLMQQNDLWIPPSGGCPCPEPCAFRALKGAAEQH